MKLLLLNIVAILCIVIAASLIWYEKGNWGWFIFLALMTAHTYGSGDE